jgi:hypothetical protein
MSEFHELFPQGRPALNKRTRYLADLLEINSEIFQPVEVDILKPEESEFLVLRCIGIDTNHSFFELFDFVYLVVDPKISNPLKSIVRIITQ